MFKQVAQASFGFQARRMMSVTAVRMAPVYFAKSHEWIDIEGDKATLGISDFAQKELGDVVYVDLPEVGTQFTAGQSFAAVESVKATDEIYTPAAGTVEEVNTALADQPELVNQEAETGGWMMKLSGVSGVPEGLMDKAAYDKFCEEQAH